MVESTALLMAAIVFDARGPHDAVAQAAVVSGYLVGFTRYVVLEGFSSFLLFCSQGVLHLRGKKEKSSITDNVVCARPY